MIDNISKIRENYSLNRIKRFLYYSVSVYRADLDVVKDSFNRPFIFSEMSLLDLDEMYLENEREISYQKYQIIYERINSRSTNIPYVVRWQNCIVGYYHIAYDSVFCSLAKIMVPNIDDNIHLFDDYTFKRFRGMGIHSFSVYARQLIGYENNRKYATVHILDGNIFSEKSYIKHGFIKLRRIHVLFKKVKFATHI